MVDHSMMPLGKLPARVDPRVPSILKFMAEPVAPVPVSVDWSHGITAWGMLGNDTRGDCTAAATGHFLQAVTAADYTEAVVTDAEVIAFYSATTGYNPADPSTDQGGVEADVLQYLLKNGFDGHHIVGYGIVDPKNPLAVKRVVADLGGAYIGVALPISAQTQNVWGEGGQGGDGAAGSWGGHAVAVMGYDATHVSFVSWGNLMKMTWAFWLTYVDEAYGLLWASFIKAGKAPNGYDIAALTAEVAALKTV